MKNVNEKTCGFESELLSYLYEDGSIESRETFELHLAECNACTDEFAAVSLARFSVYEWHREEFLPMETPQIVIPYEDRPASIWESLREAFSFNWATASIVAASLLVVAVVGAVFISNRGSGEIVSSHNSNIVSIPTPTNIDSPKPPTIVQNDANVPLKASTVEPSRDVRATRTIQTKRDRRSNQSTVRNEVKPAMVATSNNKRSLDSVGDDSEDDSLRLSDLLDAEDTRL